MLNSAYFSNRYIFDNEPIETFCSFFKANISPLLDPRSYFSIKFYCGEHSLNIVMSFIRTL